MAPEQDADLRRRARGRGTAQVCAETWKFRPPDSQELEHGAGGGSEAQGWHFRMDLADRKSLLGEGGRGLLNEPKARAMGACEGRRQGQCMTGGKGRNSNSRLEGSGPVEAGGRGHETADAAHRPRF